MEHGTITSVTFENGAFICTVQPVRGSEPYQAVPVVRPYSGTYVRPRVGQKVALEQLDDGKRVILGFITRHPSDEFPDGDQMAPEDMTIQVDEETVIGLERRQTDKREYAYDLNLKASGDITVETPRDKSPKPTEDSQITVVSKGEDSTINVRNEGKNGAVTVEETGRNGTVTVRATGSESTLNVRNTGTSGTVNLEATGSSGSITVAAPQSGNIDIDGGSGTIAITASNGDITIDGIDFDKHVHPENDNGGTTDGPQNP